MASALTTSSFVGKAVVAKATSAKASRTAVVVRAADSYPEVGKSPYDGDFSSADVPWPNWAANKSDEEITKLCETELIHGRWAMMGVAGAWAAEQGTGIPWFKVGALCTPDDCTAFQSPFPGEKIPLAPEGSDYPNFYLVLLAEVLLIGWAECYRTGLIDNVVFPELEVGDLHPGGQNFDPLNFADKYDLDRMKLAEIKHARLSMAAWLGFLAQAFATNPGPGLPSYSEGAIGPYAAWLNHVSNPWVENAWKALR
eukprot:CAMPEP_0182866940 /NCGR_PEP_ID=MMETSP0034_2-20130328/8458_1 /TAXON_ID=156128 /ORGANISM="Nephroselmis pyriformis, Strain CCMP717" /LENGTH=254 /DNA_ID=CAMNT_0024999273 /DNA_START=21 /DNA_END=785 /DNA_ORIENTATION=-